MEGDGLHIALEDVRSEGFEHTNLYDHLIYRMQCARHFFVQQYVNSYGLFSRSCTLQGWLHRLIFYAPFHMMSVADLGVLKKII